jgi:hypothetical protein
MTTDRRKAEEMNTTIFEFFNQDIEKCRLWMNTPNPALGGVPPVDMIILGRGHVLLEFIRASLEENQVEQ